jgi:hypothetical protein
MSRKPGQHRDQSLEREHARAVRQALKRKKRIELREGKRSVRREKETKND